jgi:acetyl-CoA carboxylase carboxyltransferase component
MFPFVGDFVIMTEQGLMYNVSPTIIQAVTGKEVIKEEIGGWKTSMNSGNCHIVTGNDEEAIEAVRQLLSYLPLNNLEDVPVVSNEDDPSRTTPEIYDIIPDDPFKIYDMHKLIMTIFDNGEFFEIQSGFAQNAITGFARIDERSAGIVANNPKVNVGCLDINSCNKISRFVRFCDAFNIPIITFVDTGGFFPSVEQEQQGILRHCAKLFYSYSEATVPLITVIVRKAYGSSYAALGSKFVGADIVYAYPSAEIALIDPETYVELEYGEEISKAENPAERRRKLVEEIREKMSPLDAASKGHIDDVIDPRFTRSKIIGALRIMETKREKLPPKKHGNPPV